MSSILPPGPEAPPPATVPGVDADAQATVEKAWWLFMRRIGYHNPRLYQSGGRALDAVNSLMRSN